MIELRSNINNRAILYSDPFKLDFYIEDYLVTSLNSKHLLKFEHLRAKKFDFIFLVCSFLILV